MKFSFMVKAVEDWNGSSGLMVGGTLASDRTAFRAAETFAAAGLSDRTPKVSVNKSLRNLMT